MAHESINWRAEIGALTLDPDDLDVIVRRGRVSALTVLCSVAVFTTTDLLAAPHDVLARHLAYKLVQVVIAGGGFLALGRPALRRHAETIVLLGIVAIIVSMLPPGTLRGDVVTGPILIGMVTLWSAALFPWHPARQATIAVTGIGAILALVHAVHGLGHVAPYPLIAVSFALAGSVVISHQIGQHWRERRRVEAVLRAREAEMRRTSERLAEEARTAATLVHVAETLHTHLRAPDMLERVNRLAVEALGCDWSGTFLWDDAVGGLRLAALAGTAPEHVTELESVVFPLQRLASPDVLRAGIIEQPDAQHASPTVAALMHRYGIASFVSTPVHRDGRIHALLVHGHRTRQGPPSRTERRLALGLAQATSVALDNACLIRDVESASALKMEFVATMSHELRTPLNVIVGYAEMLADEAAGPLAARQRDPIVRIRENALELLELINATLDLNRLDAGRMTIELATVPIGPLVADVARELEQLVARDVVFRTEMRPSDAVVVTDRAKLKTIVKNLAGNALKFTARGTVTVEALVDTDGLTVTVRDTGVGIAAEHLPVIFDVFRQIDGSSTRRFGGVGLGLHIVKRLVDLLGGTVDVSSVPGVGSTFAVRFPVAAALRSTGT